AACAACSASRFSTCVFTTNTKQTRRCPSYPSLAAANPQLASKPPLTFRTVTLGVALGRMRGLKHPRHISGEDRVTPTALEGESCGASAGPEVRRPGCSRPRLADRSGFLRRRFML